MIKQLQTTRTCSVCGQKKPLVAFLELAGEKGHTYGDICAACRGSGRGRKKVSEDPGEKSGGTTRLQIDNKTRVQLEHDKKEQLKQSSEQDYEEKIKKEAEAEEKTSEGELREEEEKRYREEYLQQKRQENTKAAKTEPNAPPSTREGQIKQAQGFYQEKARVTNEFHKQAGEQQLGKKTLGLTPEYINRYVSATGRSAESLFGQFLGQFLRNHIKAQDKKGAPGQSKPSQQAEKGKSTEAGKTETQENTAVDFARNNFKKR